MTEQADYFNYLRKRSFTGFLYRKFLLYPKLAVQVTGRVLDVGCGIGDFIVFLPGTVGVDINPYTINWCQSKGLDAYLMQANTLPFDNGSFDCVVLDNVLEHIDKPLDLLSDIHRVLVPNGRLLVGVPGKRGYNCDPDHKVFYEESNLEHVMSEVGLYKKKLFYMPLKSQWLATRLSQYCLYGVFERS